MNIKKSNHYHLTHIHFHSYFKNEDEEGNLSEISFKEDVNINEIKN